MSEYKMTHYPNVEEAMESLQHNGRNAPVKLINTTLIGLADHDEWLSFYQLKSASEKAGIQFSLSKNFERMYDPNPQMLILKEKYGHRHLFVDGPDEVSTQTLAIIRERLEEDYWYPSYMTAKQIGELTHEGKKLYVTKAATDLISDEVKSGKLNFAPLKTREDFRAWKEKIPVLSSMLSQNECAAVAISKDYHPHIRLLARLALHDDTLLANSVGYILSKDDNDVLKWCGSSMSKLSPEHEARVILELAGKAENNGDIAAYRRHARSGMAFLASRGIHEYESIDWKQVYPMNIEMGGTTRSLEETWVLVKEKMGHGLDETGRPMMERINFTTQHLAGLSDEDMHIALLQNIISHGNMTLSGLRRAGYSNYVIQGVKLLTPQYGHHRDVEFFRQAERIASSSHRGAKYVKWADCIYLSLEFPEMSQQMRDAASHHAFVANRMREALNIPPVFTNWKSHIS